MGTLTANEKRNLIRTEQSEIRVSMKHAAVQADTRSDVHPTALMRIGPDLRRKARFAVVVFTDLQQGRNPMHHRQYHNEIVNSSSTVAGAERLRVFESRGTQLKIRNSVVSKLQNFHWHWAWNITSVSTHEHRCMG